jgi:hypothetical protein
MLKQWYFNWSLADSLTGIREWRWLLLLLSLEFILLCSKIVDITLADAQSDDCNSTANDKEG